MKRAKISIESPETFVFWIEACDQLRKQHATPIASYKSRELSFAFRTLRDSRQRRRSRRKRSIASARRMWAHRRGAMLLCNYTRRTSKTRRDQTQRDSEMPTKNDNKQSREHASLQEMFLRIVSKQTDKKISSYQIRGRSCARKCCDA